jgi:hypothetical protein
LTETNGETALSHPEAEHQVLFGLDAEPSVKHVRDDTSDGSTEDVQETKDGSKVPRIDPAQGRMGSEDVVAEVGINS